MQASSREIARRTARSAASRLLHTTGTDRQQAQQAAKASSPAPKPVITFNAVKAGAAGAKPVVDFIINHVPTEHRWMLPSALATWRFPSNLSPLPIPLSWLAGMHPPFRINWAIRRWERGGGKALGGAEGGTLCKN